MTGVANISLSQAQQYTLFVCGYPPSVSNVSSNPTLY